MISEAEAEAEARHHYTIMTRDHDLTPRGRPGLKVIADFEP